MKSLKQIAADMLKRFLAGDVHTVITVYNKFVSTIHQETKIVQLLPLPVRGDPDKKPMVFSGYTEPEEDMFLTKAAVVYLFYQLQSALFNSRLSEQAARMTAMENATNNSEDLIHRYARARNRVRQATITNELIEIISGKEAMKE
jgi:F-type H+-transporting ATPase subunit gamma